MNEEELREKLQEERKLFVGRLIHRRKNTKKIKLSPGTLDLLLRQHPEFADVLQLLRKGADDHEETKDPV